MMGQIVLWIDSKLLEPLDAAFCAGLEKLLDMWIAQQEKQRKARAERLKKQVAAAALRKLEETEIEVNAQCFACGHRKGGRIQYDPNIQRIIHACGVCGAVRPEMPVYPVKAWDFVGRDLKQNKERELEIMARFNGPSVEKLAADAQKKTAEQKIEMVH